MIDEKYIMEVLRNQKLNISLDLFFSKEETEILSKKIDILKAKRKEAKCLVYKNKKGKKIYHAKRTKRK